MSLKCPICNKSILNRRSFKLHLRQAHSLSHLDSEQIIVDTLYGKQNVINEIQRYKNCECSISSLNIDIALLIKLLGFKRSSSEERKTERYKQKYKSSILAKYGVDNISKSKIIQQRKEDTIREHYGSYEEYLKECRHKMRNGYDSMVNDEQRKHEFVTKVKQSFKNKYGVDNPAKVDFVRAKISKSLKERMKLKTSEERFQITLKARKTMTENGSISNLERRVWDILRRFGFSFRTNKFLFGYSWDIIFDDSYDLLEIQGDYYHANPTKYKKDDILMTGLMVSEVWEKDRIKREIAEENGFHVHYLWEHEINSMSDEDILEYVSKILIGKNNEHS